MPHIWVRSMRASGSEIRVRSTGQELPSVMAERWLRARTEAVVAPLRGPAIQRGGHTTLQYDVQDHVRLSAWLRRHCVSAADMRAMLADVAQMMGICVEAHALPIEPLWGYRLVFVDVSSRLRFVIVPWDLGQWVRRQTSGDLLRSICRHARPTGDPEARCLFERLWHFVHEEQGVVTHGRLRALLGEGGPFDLAAAPAFSGGSGFALRNLCTGQVIPLDASRDYVLGRDACCDVVVTGSRRVSREHARVRSGPDGITIADTGSTNGTFVEGTRLVPRQPTRLTCGQVFSLAGVALCVEAR